MSKRVRYSRLFFSMFLSYILMLVLPILVFTISLVTTDLNAEKKDDLIKCKIDSDVFVDSMDDKFLTIKNLVNQSSSFSWVWKMTGENDFLTHDFDAIKQKEIINDLKIYTNKMGNLVDMAIFFPQKNMVVSNSGWFDTRSYINYLGDDFKNLENELYARHDNEIIKANSFSIKGKDVLLIFHSLDLMESPRAQAVLMLDKSYLIKEIKALSVENYYNIKIKDSKNNEIISITNEKTKDNPLVFTTTRESDILGLKYEITIKHPSPTVQTDKMFIIIICCLFCLVLGPVIAYFLAIFSYQPINKILNRVITGNKYKARYKEYEVIEESISQLEIDKKKMEQRAQDYSKYAQNDLLIRLTKGIFNDEGLYSKLSYYGFNYTDDNVYAVIVISNVKPEFNNESLDSIVKYVIKINDILKKYQTNSRIIDTLDDNIVIVLSNCYSTLDTQILKSICDNIKEELKNTVKVFYGNVEQGILGISKSYHFAKELTDKFNFVSSNERLFTGYVHFYYPTDWEQQLVNSLKTGKKEIAQKIYTEIKNENEKRNLSEDIMANLCKSILETISRLSNELNLNSLIDDINETLYEKNISINNLKEINEYWIFIETAIDIICNRTEYSDVSSSNISTLMFDYINEHFDNPDLSLKVIASDLKISVSTASKAFKTKTGINFHEYVCRLRMEKAKELLKNPKNTVKYICVQTGYDNEYSFRRSFLRQEGISVSDYRKTLN